MTINSNSPNRKEALEQILRLKILLQQLKELTKNSRDKRRRIKEITDELWKDIQRTRNRIKETTQMSSAEVLDTGSNYYNGYVDNVTEHGPYNAAKPSLSESQSMEFEDSFSHFEPSCSPKFQNPFDVSRIKETDAPPPASDCTFSSTHVVSVCDCYAFPNGNTDNSSETNQQEDGGSSSYNFQSFSAADITTNSEDNSLDENSTLIGDANNFPALDRSDASIASSSENASVGSANSDSFASSANSDSFVSSANSASFTDSNEEHSENSEGSSTSHRRSSGTSTASSGDFFAHLVEFPRHRRWSPFLATHVSSTVKPDSPRNSVSSSAFPTGDFTDERDPDASKEAAFPCLYCSFYDLPECMCFMGSRMNAPWNDFLPTFTPSSCELEIEIDTIVEDIIANEEDSSSTEQEPLEEGNSGVSSVETLVTNPEDQEIQTNPEDQEIQTNPEDQEFQTNPEDQEIQTNPEDQEIQTNPEEEVVSDEEYLE